MEAKSLGDMLRRTANRVPDKVAMLAPNKNGFDEIRYRDLLEKARTYASTLYGMGLRRGDKVVIVSENCIEWAFADWGCQTLGITVVPVYPTLPADQVGYLVRDSQAKLVIAGSPDQMAKVILLDGIRSILLKGEDSLDSLANSGKDLLSLEAWNHEIDQIDREDIATIIYTSGTTGLPKGAMLANRTFLHVCECAQRQLPLNENDMFLTFLPMSHVYERVAGQCLPIYMGATIAFSKSLASLATEFIKVRPTILLCVPRFLESFRDKVTDGVSKMPPLRQKLFHMAMNQGIAKTRGQFAPFAGLLDKLVMGKVRDRLGGRINHPDRNQYWTVGESLGMEIKIAEDGEILVKGPGLMTGYFNLPDETARAIDPAGWFHTGDIGEFEGTNLKITDRKKDLIVLGNGKNVAPQPIENKLTASPFISEAVVLGDGMEYCVALIIPNFEAVRTSLGLAEGTDYASNPEVKSLIKREIDKTNKTLANFEIIKKHAILSAPFTIDGGELTPTLKVKRKVVKEKYASIISEMRR